MSVKPNPIGQVNNQDLGFMRTPGGGWLCGLMEIGGTPAQPWLRLWHGDTYTQLPIQPNRNVFTVGHQYLRKEAVNLSGQFFPSIDAAARAVERYLLPGFTVEDL
jgi:hypothetical protein